VTVLGNDVPMRYESSDTLDLAKSGRVSGRISVWISYTVKGYYYQREVLNFEVGFPVLFLIKYYVNKSRHN
jgi:predicted alpha/beta hydrolase